MDADLFRDAIEDSRLRDLAREERARCDDQLAGSNLTRKQRRRFVERHMRRWWRDHGR